MRKYKAKMRYCNKWVYGNLVNDKFLKYCINDDAEGVRAIDPITLCEETGFIDMHNTRIFTNDFVCRKFSKGVIVKRHNKFYIRWGRFKIEKMADATDLEVYRNEYDEY